MGLDPRVSTYTLRPSIFVHRGCGGFIGDKTQGEVGISSAELGDLCMACTRCGWDCATSTGVGTGMSSRDHGDVGNNGKGQKRGNTPDVMGGLKVHVGIGCGRVSCFHVGSDKNGWQLVVSGDVFETQVSKPASVCGRITSPEGFRGRCG